MRLPSARQLLVDTVPDIIAHTRSVSDRRNVALTVATRNVYIAGMDAETPIARAIRLAGGAAAFAKLLGESTQTVSNWRARGEPPANRCRAIEEHTGVSRRELRSDWRDYWPELELHVPPPAEPAEPAEQGA